MWYPERPASQFNWRRLRGLVAVIPMGLGALAAHTIIGRHAEPYLKRGAVDPRTGCGVVSLSLVGHWLGVPAGIDKLNDLTDSGESGITSLLDLKQAASQLGLVSEGVRLDASRPIPWRLPTILHVQANHFVAVLPLEDDRLVVVDPPREPEIVERSRLSGDWDGISLIVSRSNSELDAALQVARLLMQ
jgi:ABC-type bacteriocin/lantibiotic exporter with double-glycine peptidase domain